ncbi:MULTISPECIES: hypothetical protein [unclassified Bradyrhizobium]|uniref:hypothetical protein n=1 Tax=Bradyrhizobium sp. USDA 4541 TaxID=2817704 RepID=UPI0020A24968|nr:hypothetical protein [Bradyrhizobium sp. USDA 4541]MCP1854221.1 hypothetical protein [Bradyrhizobium sp. USDA 4541]
MNESLSLALMAICATIVTYVWLRYTHARKELARLKEYEFFADKFFKASEALVSEPDTPPGLLAVIAVFNEIIDNPRLTSQFFKIYSRFARERIEGTRARKSDPEIAAFTKRHPHLEPVVTDAMMGGVLALSFLDPRNGTQHRAMLADLCGRERKPTTVIDAITETRHAYGSAMPAAA